MNVNKVLWKSIAWKGDSLIKQVVIPSLNPAFDGYSYLYFMSVKLGVMIKVLLKFLTSRYILISFSFTSDQRPSSITNGHSI